MIRLNQKITFKKIWFLEVPFSQWQHYGNPLKINLSMGQKTVKNG